MIIEASGGITQANVADYFSPGVDVISQGSLTQGYKALDFSLKVPQPESFKNRAKSDGSEAAPVVNGYPPTLSKRS